jgi:DNA-binding protein HU-beta
MVLNFIQEIKGEIMNKTELIDKMADACGFSKADAGRAVDAFTDIVAETLAAGGDVVLVGHGTYTTSQRSARTGRNPQTGEIIQIAATRVPKFKAGKKLKNAVK